MRICLLADAQSPHTARWSDFFCAQGHDVHVVSFRPAELSGVQVYVFSWGKGLGKMRYLLYPIAIRRLVRRLQPDILHAHHATSYGFIGALTGWHPYLIHTWGRDVLDFPRYRIYRALVGFNLRQADLITCTSQVMARAVERLVQPKTPIHIVPFGVDLTHFRPRPHPKPPTEPLVIGVVKSLEELYGIEFLIHAFASLCVQYSDLKLLIVGDGTQRTALESLASKLDIAESTRFVGRVPHDQVICYLHEMDIFVVPSLQESFGVAAVEAGAAELPILASNVGGLPEVVVDGETGFLVPRADVEALSGRLSQLITDSALRQRMGQAGRAFIKAHYDGQVNAAQMESLYQSLVRR